MTGFNLPPGVNINDLPGNRPEDLAEERFWEELDERFAECGNKQWLDAITYITNSRDLSDAFSAYVELARDLGAELVVAQYIADVSESEYWEQEHLDDVNWQMRNWAEHDKKANTEET